MKTVDKKSNIDQYIQYIENLKPDQLSDIRHYARNRVIEPFEGQKSMETIQNAFDTMDKGLKKIKSIGQKTAEKISTSKLKSFGQKTAEKISTSKLTFITKSRLGDIKQSSEFFGKVGKTTEEIQHRASSIYRDAEEKVRKNVIAFIKKGLEISIQENYEDQILKKAKTILKPREFTDLNQIRDLSNEDRDKLINVLYPFDSTGLRKLLKSFDISMNILMGTLVATNLPGTGIVVSLINMAKTLVTTANRLSVMSALFGYKIVSTPALFRACAAILQSIETWETDKDHVPLLPEILSDLYEGTPESDDTALDDLLKAVGSKEMYIAIPGVGMLSISKINLDSIKMDMVIRNLVQDYFIKEVLLERDDTLCSTLVIEDMKVIYRKFIEANYFSIIRKQLEAETKYINEKKWKNRLKLISGIDDPLFEKTSYLLDQSVESVFSKTYHLPSELKEKVVNDQIKAILTQKQNLLMDI